jgi:hypothetical protein
MDAYHGSGLAIGEPLTEFRHNDFPAPVHTTGYRKKAAGQTSRMAARGGDVTPEIPANAFSFVSIFAADQPATVSKSMENGKFSVQRTVQ